MPAHGGEQYAYVQDIIAAGIPVIITETGDHNAPGTNGSPFVSAVLPWADRHGVSYLGWTWNAWQNPDNILIRNSSGTPTDGTAATFTITWPVWPLSPELVPRACRSRQRTAAAD